MIAESDSGDSTMAHRTVGYGSKTVVTSVAEYKQAGRGRGYTYTLKYVHQEPVISVDRHEDLTESWRTN